MNFRELYLHLTLCEKPGVDCLVSAALHDEDGKFQENLDWSKLKRKFASLRALCILFLLAKYQRKRCGDDENEFIPHVKEANWVLSLAGLCQDSKWDETREECFKLNKKFISALFGGADKKNERARAIFDWDKIPYRGIKLFWQSNSSEEAVEIKEEEELCRRAAELETIGTKEGRKWISIVPILRDEIDKKPKKKPDSKHSKKMTKQNSLPDGVRFTAEWRSLIMCHGKPGEAILKRLASPQPELPPI